MASLLCNCNIRAFAHEKHAEFRLGYTDSTCWEIFSARGTPLQLVRSHLKDSASILVYDSVSENRGLAFTRAGLGECDEFD